MQPKLGLLKKKLSHGCRRVPFSQATADERFVACRPPKSVIDLIAIGADSEEKHQESLKAPDPHRPSREADLLLDIYLPAVDESALAVPTNSLGAMSKIAQFSNQKWALTSEGTVLTSWGCSQSRFHQSHLSVGRVAARVVVFVRANDQRSK